VQGTTRLAFTELAIAAAGGNYTLTATVGEARHVVATGTDSAWPLSDELRALLAATFGDPELEGQILTPQFTSTDLAPA
jgi:hypothetical protein